MAPRLAHKKSRKGCRRCKERKVKCGEELPACSACARHGVPCEYAEEPRSTSASESQIEGSGRSSESGDSKSSPAGLDAPYSRSISADFNLPEPKRHAVELYLVHRFKSSVAVAFPSSHNPELEEILVWTCVDMGFNYPYLLNAIFAITSLYVWITAPAPQTEDETKPIPESLLGVDYGQLHRLYMNRSISQQRDALAALTPDNADAIGLTAVLLATMATCLLSDEPESVESMYAPPLQWLTMHASIASVFRDAVPFLEGSGPMMRYFTPADEPNFFDSPELFNPENALPFQKLLDFQDHSDFIAGEEESDPLVVDAYVKTTAFIGSIHQALQQTEPRYRICLRVVAFGHVIPKTFIHLVVERRPRALAILANYMTFVKHIDHYWWFRGRAEKEIFGLGQILPQQWQWALTWPKAVLADPQKIILDPKHF